MTKRAIKFSYLLTWEVSEYHIQLLDSSSDFQKASLSYDCQPFIQKSFLNMILILFCSFREEGWNVDTAGSDLSIDWRPGDNLGIKVGLVLQRKQ